MIPEYFAYFCLLFGFIGIYKYIKDITNGETRPNIVSWIFWSIAPLIGVYFGYKSGISLPLLVSTFSAGFFPLIVVIFSLFNKNSYWKITRFDIVCGVISFLALIIWLTTRNGILSLTFSMLADLSASIPTIIKSWKYSQTETATPYSYGILNQIITFLIMRNPPASSLIFPIYFIVVNTIIILGINKSLRLIDNKIG